jgi:hypothetical protein
MVSAGLQHLYWHRPTERTSQLENFTSAALAVAINHDPQPFIRALERVRFSSKWGLLEVDLRRITDVEASVQEYLPPISGRDGGFLDLVISLRDNQGGQDTLW